MWRTVTSCTSSYTTSEATNGMLFTGFPETFSLSCIGGWRALQEEALIEKARHLMVRTRISKVGQINTIITGCIHNNNLSWIHIINDEHDLFINYSYNTT